MILLSSMFQYSLFIFLLLHQVSSLDTIFNKFQPKIHIEQFHGFKNSEVFLIPNTLIGLFIENETSDLKYTNDGGFEWKTVDIDKLTEKFNKKSKTIVEKPNLIEILINPFNKHDLKVRTDSDILIQSSNAGKDWSIIKLPEKFPLIPDKNLILNNFNNTWPFEFSKKTILFTGNCLDDSCLNRRYYYTNDNFKNFDSLTIAKKCLSNDDKIFCLYNGKLLSSTDYFKEKNETTINDNLIDLIYLDDMYITHNGKTIYFSEDGKDWLNYNFTTTSDFKLIKSSFPNSLMKLTNNCLEKLSINFEQESISLQKSLNNLHYYSNKVDYEPIDSLQGVILANQRVKDSINSKITFDNGETWENLSIKENSNSLQLHSIIRKFINNNEMNKNYKSSYLPSVILGNGNEGETVTSYDKSNVFISKDGGYEWELVLKGPHLLTIGNNGGVLVAVPDDGLPTNLIKISFDYGKNWYLKEIDESLFKFKELIRIIDDNGQEFFLLIGDDFLVSLNFNEYFDNLKKCSIKDFDQKFLRDKDYCFNGFSQSFSIKNNFECAINELKKIEKIPCYCIQKDYECSKNFKNIDGKCVSNNNLTETCNEDELILKPSGYSKKQGNLCVTDDTKGLKLDEAVEVPCKNNQIKFKDKNPVEKLGKKTNSIDKNIEVGIFHNFTFDSNIEKIDYLYNKDSDDEKLIVLLKNQKCFITFNHGESFQQISNHLIQNYFINKNQSIISLITTDNLIIYSQDNGYNWHSYPSPIIDNEITQIEYHNLRKNWVIVTGKIDKLLVSYISTDLGKTWLILKEKLSLSCLFGFNHLPNIKNDSLIFCPNGNRLISSIDFFTNDEQIIDNNLINLWGNEFNLIRVSKDSIFKTTNGIDWQLMFTNFSQKDKKFSFNSKNGHFLSIDVFNRGSIFKPNFENKKFIKVIENAEIETIEYLNNLEGIIMTNIVQDNKLQTQISFNDGINWQSLPKKLNLKTFQSSISVPGLIYGVDSHQQTYLSINGGYIWSKIFKEEMHVKILDSGSLIIMVDTTTTDSLDCSTDYGKTWNKLKIFEFPVVFIESIHTTLNEDSSKLLMRSRNSLYIISFNKLLSRNCKIDPYIGSSDFENFQLTSNCLFGEKFDYLRKKPNSVCLIGKTNHYELLKKQNLNSCLCGLNDFECDINFKFNAKTKTCQFESKELEESFLKNYSINCNEFFNNYYFEIPSGFRKNSISNCIDGQDFELSTLKKCPNKKIKGLKLQISFFIGILIIMLSCLINLFFENLFDEEFNNLIILKFLKKNIRKLINFIGRKIKDLISMVIELIKEGNHRNKYTRLYNE